MDKTLAIAESITGGGICARLTDIPGVSSFFEYGIVCYGNEAKQKLLGVKKETLEKYTAVSAEVALEMSKGLQNLTNANICLCITGEAGPTSGSGKPIGEVYIAVNNIAYSYNFEGTREEIREQATMTAFELLAKLLGL